VVGARVSGKKPALLSGGHGDYRLVCVVTRLVCAVPVRWLNMIEEKARKWLIIMYTPPWLLSVHATSDLSAKQRGMNLW
jgi:hypothetical protein